MVHSTQGKRKKRHFSDGAGTETSMGQIVITTTYRDFNGPNSDHHYIQCFNFNALKRHKHGQGPQVPVIGSIVLSTL